MTRLLLIVFAIPILPAAFFMLRYKWYIGRAEPAYSNRFWIFGFGYILLYVLIFHVWLHAY
jgi:hypothetical protein